MESMSERFSNHRSQDHSDNMQHNVQILDKLSLILTYFPISLDLSGSSVESLVYQLFQNSWSFDRKVMLRFWERLFTERLAKTNILRKFR